MTRYANITDKDKFKHLCDLTTSLVGLRKGSLRFKSRKHDVHLPRLIASNIGMQSDIHRNIIAEVLNRDRVLIYHYEKTHKSNYSSWPKYREMFNMVIKAYEELQSIRPTFHDSMGLKGYLLEFVTEDNPNQAEILVVSGKVGCKIKSTCSNLSHMLKNIQFALKNYNHSIKVNLL